MQILISLRLELLKEKFVDIQRDCSETNKKIDYKIKCRIIFGNS